MTTARATRPPVHAPAPPVQRRPAGAEGAREQPHRLLRSLTAVPAVQRQCAACSSDDDKRQSPVMPQLVVGPVDDPFEREADSIAGQVMAMRHSDVAPGPAQVQRNSIQGSDEDSGDPVLALQDSVQRRCAACSPKEERSVRPRRRDLPASLQRAAEPLLENDPLRDLEAVPRMKPADQAGATETIAASASQLTSGGSPLSSVSRAFFESRMGRDLSGVRIHRGSEGQALNESIAARAFTYQNHIWLGKGESEGNTFTMAHELAHVLQQTAPGPAPPMRLRRIPTNKVIKAVFGGAPYWTSKKLTSTTKGAGSQIHQDVLEQFQLKHPSLFTEAPISRSLWGSRARSGQADLYKGLDKSGSGERTIGINFKAGNVATNTSYIAQPNHSPIYNHASQSRPRVSNGGKIWGLDEAPVTIQLGELKPNHSKKYAKQLASYRASIERTRQRSNKLAVDQHADPATQPPTWPELMISGMKVDVPSLVGKKGASFGEHELEVRQYVGLANSNSSDFAVGTLIYDPPKPVKGHLRLRLHTDGVYYYWWEPLPSTVSSTLPPDLKAKWPLTKKLFQALRSSRKVVLPRRRLAPQVQRKSGNAKKINDPFDKAYEATWNSYQKTVAKNFVEPNGSNLMTNHYLMAIDKSLEPGDSKGIERTQKAQNSAVYQQVDKYRTIKLIASPFAPAMARLRRIFGHVFVKASELYQTFKAKFDSRSRSSKSLSGGGILGALLRAAFKVLRLIGRQVVATTMIQLTSQLQGCMEKMFQDWFSNSETVEAVQERIEGVRGDLEQSVETFIGGKPEDLAETIFGPYGKQIDAIRSYIETITDIAGPILTAYKVVRWGIQAVACLSPPALGCLWGLAAGAIEWAAGQIMDTCWFMKEVTPAIIGIPQIGTFIRNTSVLLSNGILETVGGILPNPVGSFLSNCKAELPKLGLPSAESICDEDDGSGNGPLGNNPMPSEAAMAFWKRWERLPFAKQMALKKLIGLDAAKAGAKADWDKMNAMLAWTENTDLSKIKELAAKVAKGEASRPPEVDAVRAAAAASAKAAAGSSTATTPKAGATKAGSAKAGATQGSGEETLSATRSSAKPEPGEPVSDLKTLMFDPSGEKPAVKDEAATGSFYVQWVQPNGSKKVVLIKGVMVTYGSNLHQDTLVSGQLYERWGVKPAKSESFHIEGRDGDFVLMAGKVYAVFVPKLGAAGGTP